MNACEFSITRGIDLGLCLKSTVLGWLPDWAWALLPYWPWLIVIGGLGFVYRVAGWPGVGAFLFGLGFLAGRRSVGHEPIETELPPRDREPAPKKPKGIFGDLVARK